MARPVILPFSFSAATIRSSTDEFEGSPSPHLITLSRLPSSTGRAEIMHRRPSSQRQTDDFIDLTADSPTLIPSRRSPFNINNQAVAQNRRSRNSSDEPLSKRRRLYNGEASEGVPRKPLDSIHLDTSPVREIEHVDLRDADDIGDVKRLLDEQRAAEIVKQQKEQSDKPLRLNTLQCVVCMDTMTDITSTICGHLFCHECIMRALLAAENNGNESGRKSKCPVCRKQVTRPKDGKDTKQVIVLELKLKTRPRNRVDKGKMKVTITEEIV